MLRFLLRQMTETKLGIRGGKEVNHKCITTTLSVFMLSFHA
jgi:hypothetical protein